MDFLAENCPKDKKMSSLSLKFHARNIQTFIIRHNSKQCIKMIENIICNFVLFQGQDLKH